MDGTGAHRFRRASSNSVSRLTKGYAGQKSRALVQVVRHRIETGAITPDILAIRRYDVESDRRAEVDDDRGRAIERSGRGCVRQSIRANRSGLG